MFQGHIEDQTLLQLGELLLWLKGQRALLLVLEATMQSQLAGEV